MTDLQSAINAAMDVVTLGMGAEFDKTVKKRLAKQILGNDTAPSTMAAIDTEIDASGDIYGDRLAQAGLSNTGASVPAAVGKLPSASATGANDIQAANNSVANPDMSGIASRLDGIETALQDLHQQPAPQPIINVTVPEQAPPVVNVTSPQITVEAPIVNVSVPEQSAPVGQPITVNTGGGKVIDLVRDKNGTVTGATARDL